MRERVATWARRVVVGLVLVVPATVAFTFLAFEVSSQPQFCGSCHIMAPYYQSWRTSTHNEVACVECHIPPGVASELRKKYEALSMVARYFTGTYSTNPWTEVDDQSCLRTGCHVKRVLLGRELYQGVIFDHQPHLAEMRREKQLRCTSCHSQIVQGSHISVTPTTCFLCHFKGARLNTGTARCTLCHAVPEKTITTAGLSFDHGDVRRFGMECMACHEGVVKGEGQVLRERCFTCHNETERIERFDETEFLHRMHVTEHKVECLNCHIEITHHVPAREEALASPCQSCHSSAAGHSPVRDVYRGIGARGVTPRPAAMYLAGIRCEACHNQPRGTHKGADDVSCMACHGPKYRTIYRSWQAGLRVRMAGLRTELDAAAARLQKRDGSNPAPLADARHNLELLDQGVPMHNPRYAVEVIEQSLADVARALADAGEPAARTPLWVQAPYETECLGCHFGVEMLTERAFDRDFPHQPHVVEARLRCTVCHGEGESHGRQKLSIGSCDGCHERIKGPMADVGADECRQCHVADIGRRSEKVRFPHEKHIEVGFDCAMCHEGVGERPHLQWAKSERGLPAFDHEGCGTCHGGDVPDAEGVPPDDAKCDVCHEAF